MLEVAQDLEKLYCFAVLIEQGLDTQFIILIDGAEFGLGLREHVLVVIGNGKL